MTEAQERYQAYLQSPHWQHTRARILERAKEHCERCGRFCGDNPHGEGGPCFYPDCEFCCAHFDSDGMRNDVELQCLEVHHKTYERRGREQDRDLIALCWGCHEGTWDWDCSWL